MASLTYLTPSPPLNYGTKGPNLNPHKHSAKARYQSNQPTYQYQISRPTSRQDLLSHNGDIISSNDDGNEVDVTLNGIKTYHKSRNTHSDNLTILKVNDKSDIESQDGFDIITTIKASADPFKNVDAPPNHDLQPTRPRIIGFGVGAINKHLSGGYALSRNPKEINPANTPRLPPVFKGASYIKGFVAPPGKDVGRPEQSKLSVPSVNAEQPPFEPTINQPQVFLRTQEIATGRNDESTAGPTVNPARIHIESHQPRAISHIGSVIKNPLPDLTRFASAEYIASLIARSPPTTDAEGNPITRPFSFAPLPYTDDDIPIPQPYNDEYPHPITAYASPRVNPEVARKSGYDRILKKLVAKDLPLTLGSRLYDAGFRDLDSSVYLLFSFEGSQGNGIPESLWSKLENVSSSRLPVGVAGVSPYARANPNISSSAMPPRFAQLNNHQATMEYGMLTPPGSNGETDYFSKPIISRNHDYDPTPRPSPGYQPMRHTVSTGELRYYQQDVNHQQEHLQSGQEHLQSGQEHLQRGHRNHQLPPSDYTTNGNSTLLTEPSDFIPTPNSYEENDSGISPFYKTELCAIWQQTGSCKYGIQCQYAHGAAELRIPRHLQNMARAASQDTKAKMGYSQQPRLDIDNNMAYLSPKRSISLQPLARAPTLGLPRAQPQIQTRNEPRRASCPPQQLATLAEVEDDHTLPLPPRQQSLQIPAPIGAERPIQTHNSNPSSARTSVSSTEKWEDMPPFILADSNYSVGSGSTGLKSQSSTINLSLSTSSGSKYSNFTYFSEKVYTYSPIEDHVQYSSGLDGLHYIEGNQASFNGHKDNKTSFNFPTSQSIW